MAGPSGTTAVPAAADFRKTRRCMEIVPLCRIPHHLYHVLTLFPDEPGDVSAVRKAERLRCVSEAGSRREAITGKPVSMKCHEAPRVGRRQRENRWLSAGARPVGHPSHWLMAAT